MYLQEKYNNICAYNCQVQYLLAPRDRVHHDALVVIGLEI